MKTLSAARRGKRQDRVDLNEAITAQVIASIQADGVAPWCRPWVGSDAGTRFPVNAVSGKNYRGVNVVVLLLTAMAAHYNSGYWLTYKQAKELGGNVIKGQKGTKIIFWKLLEDKKDPKNKIPLMRGYTVFNAEQCEGLPSKFYVTPEEAAEQIKPDATNTLAETLMAASECPITHEGTRAFYAPNPDAITLPPPETFKSWAGYYTSAFHEMGHSTGHKSRLDRDMAAKVHTYAKEELVAEFTACFLSAECGFARETFGNSVSYLKVWVSKLKEQPKMLAWAAQAAQRATDRILATTQVTERQAMAAPAGA